MAEELHFHVDVDAFYASVEQFDHPELRGKPVIVGAMPGHRGVVSACSYEARRHGVHSAMPISQAYRLCPEASYLPVRMSRYIEVSESIMDLLREMAPVFQQISVDEAAMDMSGTERLYGDPEGVGRTMKERVAGKSGLTISVGIGPNRYLAKLASEYRKPDGLYRVRASEAEAFVGALPLAKLWGVGEKTLARLEAAGIRSVAELRETPHDLLASRMGGGCAEFLHRIARGGDPGIHPVAVSRHSISTESTFERDTTDAEVIRLLVLELSQELAERLIREGKSSQIVTLKLRLEDFSTTSAQKSLGRAVVSSDEIAAVAMQLLGRRWDRKAPVRLVGVGLDDVVSRDGWVQGELLDDARSRTRRVEEAVASIRSRFDGIPVTRASLLRKQSRRPGSGAPGAK